ncbi:MAG: DUF5658 family protein [Desulforhopalus sp.]
MTTSIEPKKVQLKEMVSTEQRSEQERRQHHIQFYKLLLFKGKRRTLRRSEDCKRISVLDQYHPKFLIYILIVLGLSLLDAVLTLTLLDKGARELNPVMRYYIDLGPGIFVMVKYGLTALALLLMIVLNATISKRYSHLSSLMFPFCVFVFGAVIIWEFYLLINYGFL